MKLHGPTLKTGSGTVQEENKVLLETQVITTSTAVVDFTSIPISNYAMFELEVEDVLPVTDDVELRLRISFDNGSTYDADADYAWCCATADTGANEAATVGAADTSISFCSTGASLGVSNIDGEGGIIVGAVAMYNLISTGVLGNGPFCTSSSMIYKPSVAGRRWTRSHGAASFNDDNTAPNPRAYGDIEAIRLLFTSGNISKGIFRLYGYPVKRILY